MNFNEFFMRNITLIKRAPFKMSVMSNFESVFAASAIIVALCCFIYRRFRAGQPLEAGGAPCSPNDDKETVNLWNADDKQTFHLHFDTFVDSDTDVDLDTFEDSGVDVDSDTVLNSDSVVDTVTDEHTDIVLHKPIVYEGGDGTLETKEKISYCDQSPPSQTNHVMSNTAIEILIDIANRELEAKRRKKKESKKIMNRFRRLFSCFQRKKIEEPSVLSEHLRRYLPPEMAAKYEKPKKIKKNYFGFKRKKKKK